MHLTELQVLACRLLHWRMLPAAPQEHTEVIYDSVHKQMYNWRLLVCLPLVVFPTANTPCPLCLCLCKETVVLSQMWGMNVALTSDTGAPRKSLEARGSCRKINRQHLSREGGENFRIPSCLGLGTWC